jgi:hypothetical protein
MREALARRIREAEQRLNGTIPMDQEIEQSRQAEELEEFKKLLAQKIDIDTRLELLLEGKFEHREQSPAVEFTIDQRTFVLLKRQEQLELVEVSGGISQRLVQSPISDPVFEDRLLVAIGEALKRVN